MDCKYVKTNNSDNIGVLINRINEGPVAVIECFEEIPCNPCETCCPKNAISFKESITSIPELDFNKCIGCGICITKCPGMAIFVLDGTFSESEGLVHITYEFLPMPEKDQVVKITGKTGQFLCNGKIHEVKTSKSFDCTAVVTLSVSKDYLLEARGFEFI